MFSVHRVMSTVVVAVVAQCRVYAYAATGPPYWQHSGLSATSAYEIERASVHHPRPTLRWYDNDLISITCGASRRTFSLFSQSPPAFVSGYTFSVRSCSVPVYEELQYGCTLLNVNMACTRTEYGICAASNATRVTRSA